MLTGNNRICTGFRTTKGTSPTTPGEQEVPKRIPVLRIPKTNSDRAGVSKLVYSSGNKKQGFKKRQNRSIYHPKPLSQILTGK